MSIVNKCAELALEIKLEKRKSLECLKCTPWGEVNLDIPSLKTCLCLHPNPGSALACLSLSFQRIWFSVQVVLTQSCSHSFRWHVSVWVFKGLLGPVWIKLESLLAGRIWVSHNALRGTWLGPELTRGSAMVEGGG